MKFDLWGSLWLSYFFFFARVTVDSSEKSIAFSSGLFEARPLLPRLERLAFHLSGDTRNRVPLFSLDLEQQALGVIFIYKNTPRVLLGSRVYPLEVAFVSGIFGTSFLETTAWKVFKFFIRGDCYLFHSRPRPVGV